MCLHANCTLEENITGKFKMCFSIYISIKFCSLFYVMPLLKGEPFL